MNSSKKKKNVSAFDENDFVPINLVYNWEQKIIKYVYTKKYHTFGNCVCVQNVKCTFLCKLQRLQAKQGIHPDTL